MLKVIINETAPFTGASVLGQTQTIRIIEGVAIFDSFMNELREEVEKNAKQVAADTLTVAADKKLVAADKATVTTLKGQTQTLKTQTETLKNDTQVLKNDTIVLADQVTADKATVGDLLVKTTAQAKISTDQATISKAQAGISTAQAKISTDQATISKTQATEAKKLVDDFKLISSVDGNLNVGGIISEKGIAINKTYETKPDAAKKLVDSKAYTDAEITKLAQTDAETLATLQKIKEALAEGGDVLTDLDNRKVDKAGSAMTGSLKFNVPANQYDIESLSVLPAGSKSMLRKFRGGNPDTIWHETIQTSKYRISTGTTDAALVMELNQSSPAVFQYPVLTNAAQSTAVNSFVRKDYVDAIDNKNVAKAGDTMTGTLSINVLDAYKTGGVHSIELNNGSIGSVNYISFGDPSDAGNEGILFPKTGKNDKSLVDEDYDILKALDGKLLFNNEEVYHKLNKPVWADVGGNAYLSVDGGYLKAGNWIKANSAGTGFLPSAQGTVGTSSIGTASWWFGKSFVDAMYTRTINIGDCTMTADTDGDLVFSV